MGELVSNAADGFAIAMLGMILLSWSVLILLFWTMRRMAAKRDSQVDALLEELQASEDTCPTPNPRSTSPTRAWEKNPDWWK
ncbi:MAG TPA: hypothetical protein VIM57_05570 [Luteolibacter sp.]